MNIPAQAGGGFADRNRGDHGVGGPAVITFTERKNSDIEDGEIRPDAPPAQLYDLEADLRQTTNVYEQYPEVVKEMEALLEPWRQ